MIVDGYRLIVDEQVDAVRSYDLASDPDEQSNAALKDLERARAMHRQLDALHDLFDRAGIDLAPDAAPRSDTELEAQERALRALGYVK